MKLSDLTIPAVAECDPKVEPMHAKVLIVPAEVPEKVGSLIMAAASHEKAVFANQRARIVALGPVAFQFEDWPAGARKPQVGDVILHESYIGEEVEGDDGRKYRLINDRAVMAVLERARPKGLVFAEASQAYELAVARGSFAPNEFDSYVRQFYPEIAA